MESIQEKLARMKKLNPKVAPPAPPRATQERPQEERAQGVKKAMSPKEVEHGRRRFNDAREFDDDEEWWPMYDTSAKPSNDTATSFTSPNAHTPQAFSPTRVLNSNAATFTPSRKAHAPSTSAMNRTPPHAHGAIGSGRPTTNTSPRVSSPLATNTVRNPPIPQWPWQSQHPAAPGARPPANTPFRSQPPFHALGTTMRARREEDDKWQQEQIERKMTPGEMARLQEWGFEQRQDEAGQRRVAHDGKNPGAHADEKLH